MKQDKCFVVLDDDTVAFRITAEGHMLLRRELTEEQLRKTVTELGTGIYNLLTTVTDALNAVYPPEVHPNGACACPSCNLIRLRDALNQPRLH